MGVQTSDLALHKLPPQHIEAEQFVLGAILLDNEALAKALEILRPEDARVNFYRPAHAKIYEAVLDLFERNEPIDLLTVSEVLRRRNQLEEVGGSTYLATLLEIVPTSANIRHYARLVREKAILRSLINVATEIIAESYEHTEDVEDLLDRAERMIFEISEQRVNAAFANLKELLKDSIRYTEQLYERHELITGLPTGFRDFDQLTAGLQPSDLIIIAARPGMGKTSFALNIARNVGIKIREPRDAVAVFSLEMSKEQLAMRMLCAEARIDSSRLRRGYLDKNEWGRLVNAANDLSEVPIFIDDSPGLSVLDIRAKARRLQAEHGLSLIIIDYLQLLRGRGRVENRQQEISEISRSLKALAKELKVPVMALSQLSRAVEQRGDRIPQLADLRESGAIEQDADLIVFIYRDEVYNKETKDKGIAKIIVGKQRNGPTGEIDLAFLKEYARFETLEKRREPF
ncbi:MAG TPA: replicative DNA helicase [Alphaproteobacteria bacterium]|nr:replicative DNA helicase [Alphaproteobacteria bacterium]